MAHSNSLLNIRKSLEQRKGRLKKVEEDYDKVCSELTRDNRLLHRHEQARVLVRQVGLKTQSQISLNISEISSTALDAILLDPYKLGVEFVERRNRTECDLFFIRGENKIDPMSAGGGAMDIASFALRIASWVMCSPKNRNCLLLDEPFKHLKGAEANIRMLEMLREISRKLNIQIIMVSDERVSRAATIENSDRLFEVKMKNRVSTVTIEK